MNEWNEKKNPKWMNVLAEWKYQQQQRERERGKRKILKLFVQKNLWSNDDDDDKQTIRERWRKENQENQKWLFSFPISTHYMCVCVTRLKWINIVDQTTKPILEANKKKSIEILSLFRRNKQNLTQEAANVYYERKYKNFKSKKQKILIIHQQCKEKNWQNSKIVILFFSFFVVGWIKIKNQN